MVLRSVTAEQADYSGNTRQI